MFMSFESGKNRTAISDLSTIEIKQVFELGLEMNKKIGADILLATDPDCDRVGAAVPMIRVSILMSGNEVRQCSSFILSQKKERDFSDNSITLSLVSTDLAEVIKNYNCKLEFAHGI